ncbi:MAG: anthranilate synthase component I family protein [Acidobacteriota bacterium]|nr:anthranilate synthase component I family protein [Acidobacteriota bacterium]
MHPNTSYHTIVQSTHYTLPDIDTFGAFMSMRAEYGAEHVFLLEALAGHIRDTHFSFIGFDPLATLRVNDRTVSVTAAPVLRTKIIEKATLDGVLIATSDSLSLPSRRGLWSFLRSVQQGFYVGDSPGKASRGLAFGFFGYLGYDTAWAIEELPRTITQDSDNWDVHLSIYRGIIRADMRGKASLVIHASDSFPVSQSIDEIKRTIAIPSGIPSLSQQTAIPQIPAPLRRSDSTDKNTYCRSVKKALDYIAIGDIYQVQIGHEISFTSTAHPFDVYRRLRMKNPSPYMYLAPFGELTLVGASPELFVELVKGQIRMRPIAGTARRSSNPEEDEQLKNALRRDEKEMAEHIMLVDLCRNDVGRVCRPGTLNVDEIAIFESYSHVHHLVSNVMGMIEEGKDSYDVIAATFPAGTMTGAPKIRAMEIIEELETTRRGVYAGAVGMIGFDNSVLMALCIRTATHHRDRFFVRASAGIVADSVPENEWRETLRKMAALYWAIGDEELNSESLTD